jgi:nucleoid-associated protein YgaU
LVGLALLIGIPYLLVRFVGNPVGAFPTSVDEITSLVDQRFVPSEVVVGVLAIAMWLLWAQYVWALMWEIVVVGPAAAKGQLARSAPLAPRVVRSVASGVVSGLLTASVVVGSSSLASLGTHAISSPAALAIESQPSMNEPAASVSQPTMAGRQIYVVGQRESLWSISGRDEAVLKRLLEINEDQIRSPVDVRPGMELILPADLHPSPTAADDSQVDPGQARSSVGQDTPAQLDDHHVVVEGDNLWNLSEARLRSETGAEPSNRDIAERVADVVEHNQDVIEDPDLIFPGEVVSITGGPDGTFQVPVSSSPPTGVDQPVDLPSSDQTVKVDTPLPDPPGRVDIGDDQPEDQGGLSLASLTTVAGGITAAGGLLALLLGLKRRRAASLGFTRARRNRITADGERLLRELAGAADQEFTAWVAAQLHDVNEQLSTSHDVTPVAVRLALNSWLSDESGVTVMWDVPMPDPVGAWRSTGPQEWFLAYDDTAPPGVPVGVGAKPAAVPGLVTVGRVLGDKLEGQELLVDLEAYGSLALGGPSDQIEAVARAITIEAASGELLSNFRVTTVGFEFEGLGRLERASFRSEEQSLAHAESIAEQHRNRPQPRTDLAGSMDWAPPDHDVELFIVKTVEATTDRWLEIASPRSGIAVLLIGDMRSSRLGARLTVDSAGVGTLTPLGVQLTVNGVLPEASVRLGALFDQLTDGPVSPDPALDEFDGPASPANVVGDWANSMHDGSWPEATIASAVLVANPDPDPDPPPAARLAAQAFDHASISAADTAPSAEGVVVVNVLGPCRCPEFPGLVSRALSLVAFLAVQPDRAASQEAIAKAVWGGRRVSDGQIAKVVAAARSHLGPTRMPKRLAGDGMYRIERVETDFHRFQRLTMQAEPLDPTDAAPLLRAALDMVTGPPFGGVAIDWAAGARFDEYCSELIEATTVRAIEVLAELDDYTGVHEVAKIGLRALPVSEPVYRACMLAAAARGQLPVVRSLYDHLSNRLSLLYPTESTSPSPETNALLAELTERVPAERA